MIAIAGDNASKSAIEASNRQCAMSMYRVDSLITPSGRVVELLRKLLIALRFWCFVR